MKQNNNMNRNSGNNLAGLTLSAVLNDKRLPAAGQDGSSPQIQSFRTLLDVIQDDQTFSNVHLKEHKRTWKNFKDKLRLRRGGSGPGSSWTSSMRVPSSEIPVNRLNSANAGNNAGNRIFTCHASAGLPQSDNATGTDIAQVPDVDRDLMSYPRSRSSPSVERNASRVVGRTSDGLDDTDTLARGREEEENEAEPTHETNAEAEERDGEGENGEHEEETADEEGGGEEQPVRMSLMALLAETDKEMGLGGSAYSTDEDEEEEDESSGAEYNCCVCMVRHKGAAFIPCGHTFCRLCCRELLVQRGSCPLCNNYIVEVLDIF